MEKTWALQMRQTPPVFATFPQLGPLENRRYHAALRSKNV
jgi:hypothetical protein